MQGIDATFDEVSFEGGDGPRRLLLKILPGAAAAALAGAVGVWVLHWCGSAPEGIVSNWTSVTAPAPSVSKPFGDIAIDADLLAQLKQPVAPAPSAQVASLETAPTASYAPFPLPALEPFVPAPAPTIPPAGSLSAPPARDLPEIGETESFPLPPTRPPELAAPTQPIAPQRHWARPEVAVARPTAPADNRNFLEKLFGLGAAQARLQSPLLRPAQPASRSSPSKGRGKPPASAGDRCSRSRIRSAIRLRSPAMIETPRSTISRPASFIFRTERGSRPIRAWVTRWTIRAM